jgi:hypothetical protein
MTDLTRLIQTRGEIEYRHTQNTQRITQAAASGVTGTMGEYDPTTGQQKVNLPDGGIMRTKSITNAGIRIGDVVPAIGRTASGQAFMDSRG